MKKTTLLTFTLAIAMLLTTACTVSDNPSGGGDNTGAGDHNVRRYKQISPSTDSVNWKNYGCTASDTENTFFANIEDDIQRLYHRNLTTGKLTIVQEIDLSEWDNRFKYVFIEDGYFYYFNKQEDHYIYNRVKTDLSQLPETGYREYNEPDFSNIFARTGKTLYLNTYANGKYAIKTWNLDNGEVKDVALAEYNGKYTGTMVVDNKLYAYKYKVVDKRTKAEIVCFDINTGEKKLIVEQCNINSNLGAVMDGRLFYFQDSELCSVDLDGNDPQTHLTDIYIKKINSHDGLLYLYADNAEDNRYDIYTYKPGEAAPTPLNSIEKNTYFEINPWGDLLFTQNDQSYTHESYYCIKKASRNIEPLLYPNEEAERLQAGLIVKSQDADTYVNIPKTITAYTFLENDATDVTVTWNIEGTTVGGTYNHEGKACATATFNSTGLKNLSCTIDYISAGKKKCITTDCQIIVLYPYNDKGVTPRTTKKELEQMYPTIEVTDEWYDMVRYVLKNPVDTLYYESFSYVNGRITNATKNERADEEDPMKSLNEFIENGDLSESPKDLRKLFKYADGEITVVYDSPDKLEDATDEDKALLNKWLGGKETEADHKQLLETAKRLNVGFYAGRYFSIGLSGLPFSAYMKAFMLRHSEKDGTFIKQEIKMYDNIF